VKPRADPASHEDVAALLLSVAAAAAFVMPPCAKMGCQCRGAAGK
jgi:hypothetical protein